MFVYARTVIRAFFCLFIPSNHLITDPQREIHYYVGRRFLTVHTMKLAQSPMTYHQFGDIHFALKRDDQLHPQFSGNKARKLAWLLDTTLPSDITTLIGYGSVQANSLYSLAALAKLKGWQLEYYVARIPQWLTASPTGNYRAALALGARIIVTETQPAEYIENVRRPDQQCLCVPEGGRSQWAQYGVEQLARELLTQISPSVRQNTIVALPSGTGTTALYLHKALASHDIQVVTCPCVGGEAYLVKQFQSLGEKSHPHILTLDNKHHFGKLDKQDYKIWQSLFTATQVEFDLLYDPMMWRCLMDWLPNQSRTSLVYIHQGGVLGNESMLPRYQRKFG